MVFAALTAALFHRLSGQERLILGTLNAKPSRPEGAPLIRLFPSHPPTATRPEVAPLIGFSLTQLPLAIDLSGDPTFRELLGRVRTVALGAFAHQHLPVGKLAEALHPQ